MKCNLCVQCLDPKIVWDQSHRLDCKVTKAKIKDYTCMSEKCRTHMWLCTFHYRRFNKERMEKQFLAEENTRIKNERRRLEADKSDLLIRVRDLTDGCRSHDNSAVDSELSDQYHTLLQEHKEQEKYLASVQQQLYQVRSFFGYV